MFCTKCGNKIRDDAKFCTFCGAPVRRPVPPAPVEPQTLGAVPPAEKPRPVEPPVPGVIPPVAPVPDEPPIPAEPVIPEEPTVPEEPVIPEEPTVPEEPVIPEEPILPEEPAFSAEPPAMPPIPPESPAMPPIPEAAPRKRRSTGMLVSLIALGVVVVGAAVGGFLLWHGMNAKLERERSDHALEQSQAEAQLRDLQDALDQSNENYDALYHDYYDLVQEYSLLQQQNENVSDLQAQYDALSEAYDELANQYSEFADLAEFYNGNACVASDDNEYYHTYACEDWDRQGFYIFNTAYAENELGLKPCPKCH